MCCAVLGPRLKRSACAKSEIDWSCNQKIQHIFAVQHFEQSENVINDFAVPKGDVVVVVVAGFVRFECINYVLSA